MNISINTTQHTPLLHCWVSYIECTQDPSVHCLINPVPRIIRTLKSLPNPSLSCSTCLSELWGTCELWVLPHPTSHWSHPVWNMYNQKTVLDSDYWALLRQIILFSAEFEHTRATRSPETSDPLHRWRTEVQQDREGAWLSAMPFHLGLLLWGAVSQTPHMLTQKYMCIPIQTVTLFLNWNFSLEGCKWLWAKIHALSQHGLSLYISDWLWTYSPTPLAFQLLGL